MLSKHRLRFLSLCIIGSLITSALAAVAQDTERSKSSRPIPAGEAYDESVPKPTLSGVRYGKHSRHTLDFWKAPAEKPTPLVFVIHGGGWKGGSKQRLHRFADASALLEAGISVVAINYRLMRHAEDVAPPVKAPLDDAARALQFVRSKAGEWNIDKSRIGAAGGSAGGCSSLWLAFHDDLADPKSTDPVARESTRLFCAGLMGPQTTLDPKQMQEWTPNSTYGGHAFGMKNFDDFLSQREQLLPWIAEYSPYALVSTDDPPTCLFYNRAPAVGEKQKDPTHTANFGVKLQERCAELGVECEVVYPGADGVRFKTPTDYLIATLNAPDDGVKQSHSSDTAFDVSTSAEGLDISENGEKVLHYQLAPKSQDGKYTRSNYIHPFYDLDGNVLTEDFPADHRWHRGIFWTWHQVLIGDQRIGDPWICERFQWDVIDTTINHLDDGSLIVSARLHWKSPDWMLKGQMVPFAKETVTLHLNPTSQHHRTIDFDIQLLALVPELKIGGSENAKGYGGFSLRIKNPLELQFRGKSGTVKARTRAVDAGKWLLISNRDNIRHNHILLLTHKTHPNSPAPWILRNHATAMQNVVYPGRHAEPVPEDPANPLSLRYRLIVHRGDVDTNTIDKWQAAYESTPPLANDDLQLNNDNASVLQAPLESELFTSGRR